jgi:hypothetical protein
MTGFKKWGQKGGRAKTAAKTQAVRLNGLRGGRPKTRTLAERLLRRRIPEKQYALVDAAFRFALNSDERAELLAHFWTDSLHTLDYSWSPPGPVSGCVRKFFVGADRRLPKNYVVIWRGVTQHEEDAWNAQMEAKYRHRPGSPPPCPEVRRKRVSLSRHPCLHDATFYLSRKPDISAQELSEACGARVPLNVAEALLRFIRYA